MKLYNFVYKTTCKVTNTFYIGMHSTNDLNDGYLGSGTILLRSIKKHGKEKHKIEIIKMFDNRQSASEFERIIVNENLLTNKNCMNLVVGGEGGNKIRWTIERRNKQKSIRIGKQHSIETRCKISMSNSGRKHTEKARRNMSLGQKGKIISKEQREKLSIAGKIAATGRKMLTRPDGTRYWSKNPRHTF